MHVWWLMRLTTKAKQWAQDPGTAALSLSTPPLFTFRRCRCRRSRLLCPFLSAGHSTFFCVFSLCLFIDADKAHPPSFISSLPFSSRDHPTDIYLHQTITQPCSTIFTLLQTGVIHFTAARAVVSSITIITPWTTTLRLSSLSPSVPTSLTNLTSQISQISLRTVRTVRMAGKHHQRLLRLQHPRSLAMLGQLKQVSHK